MSLVATYACAICQRQRQAANHWLLVWLNAGQFISQTWNDELAQFSTVQHVCGAEHALTLYSRYLSSGTLSERKSA